MIKQAFFATIMLALAACGPAPEDSDGGLAANIGTLEQPIYMSSGVGFLADFFKCPDADWPGGECWVPDNNGDNVKFRLVVLGSTCSDSLIRSHMLIATQNFVADMQFLGIDAEIDPQVISARDQYILQCGTPAGGAIARNVLKGRDTHNTARGKLIQHGSGVMKFSESRHKARSGWVNGDSMARVRGTSNAIKHELWHLFLGHHPTSEGHHMLLSNGHSDALSSPVWQSFLQPTASEVDAVDCYTATSGSGDSC